MLQTTDSTPVFLLDDTGVILECNWRACEFAGMKRHDMEGKPISEFILFDRESNSLLAGETTYFITDFAHKDGSKSTVTGILSSFSREGTQAHHLTIFDVSIWTSRSSNDRYENIKLLAGYVGHDLSNILNGIMGSLSTLSEGVEDANEYERLLENAVEGAARASKLTNHIIAFSQGDLNSMYGKEDSFAPGKHETTMSAEFEGGKLLVLETDRLVSETATGMLHSLGYTVDLVSEGLHAREKFRDSLAVDVSYKAVILELSSEDRMTVLDTLKYLSDMDPDVKAIISSGYALHDVMLNHKKYGFKSALVKPYTVRELYQALDTALGE